MFSVLKVEENWNIYTPIMSNCPIRLIPLKKLRKATFPTLAGASFFIFGRKLRNENCSGKNAMVKKKTISSKKKI